MTEHVVKFADDGVDVTLLPVATVTSDDLPQGTYTFAASQFRGVWLTHCAPVPEVTGRVYGDTVRRVGKTMSAFRRRQGNTGVLLAGEPGMGKSLFIKLLAAEARKAGMPVIVIRQDYGSAMVDILSKVHTECLVVMDEFEKIFHNGGDDDDDEDKNAQNKLLSLMDGMTDNKKLFVASVNDVYRVSKFMLNRPGRFYYHFTFTNLDQAQISEYLSDRLADKGHLDGLLMALIGHKVNYDGLDALVGEINSGVSPEEALQDLNLDRGGQGMYDARMMMNGTEWKASSVRLDITSNGDLAIYLYGTYDDSREDVKVKFKPADIRMRRNTSWDESMFVPGSALRLSDLPTDREGNRMANPVADKLELVPHVENYGFRSFAGQLDV